MTLILYFLLLFSNLIFALKKKDSKILNIITLIGIILLISGAGPGNEFSRDYDNYKMRYDNVSNMAYFNDPQIGYTLLMKIGNSIGLGFFSFRILIIAICFIGIYILVIKRYKCNKNYILLLYMIYPMIIESEHFRNFISMSILLISIRFLERNTIKNNIIVLLIILFATSIHTVFILYVPIIFVNQKNKNNLIKGIVVATVLLLIITFFNNNRIPFIQQIINLFIDDRLDYYLGINTKLGFLIPISLHLTSILLVSWARKIISKENLDDNFAKSEKNNNIVKDRQDYYKVSNVVYWLNIICVLYFPLFMMNTNFYRLTRNLLILNFVLYSIISTMLKRKSLYRFIFNLTTILSMFCWLIVDLIIRNPREAVLIPFFFKNVFFNQY